MWSDGSLLRISIYQRNFQENRQPSGRVSGSAYESDTCALFMTEKPSGNYLDGSGEHNRMN